MEQALLLHCASLRQGEVGSVEELQLGSVPLCKEGTAALHSCGSREKAEAWVDNPASQTTQLTKYHPDIILTFELRRE